MNLLAVDWDYFFPTKEMDSKQWHLYDWGHNENWKPALSQLIWNGRAATFHRCGMKLPGTSGLEKNFWERFTFSPDVKLFVADSNVFALDQRVFERQRSWGQVWLFDAHHDSGYLGDDLSKYRGKDLDCGNWMIYYFIKAFSRLRVRYPKWRHWAMDHEPEPPIPVDRQVDNETPVSTEFQTVFLCRSSTWVPPWLDKDFAKFMKSFPGDKEIIQCVKNRKFSLKDALNSFRVFG